MQESIYILTPLRIDNAIKALREYKKIMSETHTFAKNLFKNEEKNFWKQYSIKNKKQYNSKNKKQDDCDKFIEKLINYNLSDEHINEIIDQSTECSSEEILLEIPTASYNTITYTAEYSTQYDEEEIETLDTSDCEEPQEEYF